MFFESLVRRKRVWFRDMLIVSWAVNPRAVLTHKKVDWPREGRDGWPSYELLPKSTVSLVRAQPFALSSLEQVDMNNDAHVYKLEHWRELENRHAIRCGRCPPHRKENDTTHRKRKARRSWKFHSKQPNQYHG